MPKTKVFLWQLHRRFMHNAEDQGILMATNNIDLLYVFMSIMNRLEPIMALLFLFNKPTCKFFIHNKDTSLHKFRFHNYIPPYFRCSTVVTLNYRTL